MARPAGHELDRGDLQVAIIPGVFAAPIPVVVGIPVSAATDAADHVTAS